MFSKFFSSARSILKPSLQTTSKSGNVTRSPNMVSTRRQVAAAEESQSDMGDAIVAGTPVSTSRKRSRKSIQDDTVTTTKGSSPAKKRKLPVRGGKEGEQAETHIHTHVAVQIPVSSVTPSSAEKPSRENSAPSSGRKGKNKGASRKRMEVQDSDHDNGDDSVHSSEEETPRPSRKPKSTSTKEAPGKAKQETAATASSAKPKHKKFGSEEPETKLPEEKVLRKSPVELLEPEDETSDDEAPEELVTEDAGQQAKRDLQAAAKALEEQESANRKKRKERDAFFKQQAEKATKKHKQQEEATNDANELDTSRLQKDNVEAPMESPEESGSGVSNDILNMKPPASNRASLPDLLPSEFLDDDESEESDNDIMMEEAQRMPKKIKFADLVEKKPKDLRKGSTTFRVAESRSMLLAPKASSQARKTKETWLQGRPGKNGATNRKPFSSGFFVGKK